MNFGYRFATIASSAYLVAACSGASSHDGPAEVEHDRVAESALASRDCAPADIVLQAGSKLVPLAMTTDDNAFYQDGQTLYVTALGEGAARERVADIPAGNTAFIYTSGKVAFVWTNPDPTSPSLGVSPLVIWTREHGPRLASPASPVGTLTTVASRDGRHVVFPSNASAGGTVGDIVFATSDLRETRTLAAGVQTDFSNGPCRPLAGFLGDGGGAYPAITYCAGSDATSTLSTFRHGDRRDLPGLANPPRLFVDPEGRRILTRAVTSAGPTSGNLLLVTEDAVTTVDDDRTGFAFFDVDGDVIYVAANPSGVEMRRARLHGTTPTIALAAPALTTFIGSGFGSDALVAPLSSPDGRWFAYGSDTDPTTGLTDVRVVDLRAPAPDATVSVLDTGTDNTTTTIVEPFTSDSAFVLYGKLNAAAGTVQLFAASVASHRVTAFGDANAFSELAASGSSVVFNDNTQGATTATPVADLKVVRLADPAPSPRLIAKGANATFFLAHDKSRVVYATDEAGHAGLHVARAL